jgi:predicted metallopeptidase
MKRIAIVVLILLIGSSSALAADLRGSWTGSSEEAGKIYLNLVRKNNNNGHTWKVADFAGLTDAQIQATTQTPVAFTLRREAGTVSFEGTFKEGYGGGQFTFSPNRQYIETLRSLGVTAEDEFRREKDIDEHLLALALHDVSTSFIRSMQEIGYVVGLDKYIAFRIFGVSPALVAELRSLGFEKLSADDLISSRIHGVSPHYIREMRAAGYRDLSMDELVSTRIHGVTAEFRKQMAALGYGDLGLDTLTSFRIHGVTAEFIRELRDLGYSNISADDLVSMRIHGVTPGFIRELREAGYSKVPVEKLVSMRIHGIDAKFVRKMNEKP